MLLSVLLALNSVRAELTTVVAVWMLFHSVPSTRLLSYLLLPVLLIGELQGRQIGTLTWTIILVFINALIRKQQELEARLTMLERLAALKSDNYSMAEGKVLRLVEENRALKKVAHRNASVPPKTNSSTLRKSIDFIFRFLYLSSYTAFF